jgi:hypothetical protein
MTQRRLAAIPLNGDVKPYPEVNCGDGRRGDYISKSPL